MATSLEESEKLDLIEKTHFGEKIVKVGPVCTEIALLRVKKINKKQKSRKVKYIARSAGWPSRLKK